MFGSKSTTPVVPVQFDLQEVVITNYAGREVNISAVGAIINIYEDMIQNCLSGDIIVHDANNLIANLPIIGQEKLRISYVTKGKNRKESEITQEFMIYKVTRQGKKEERRSESYMLHFCSPEGYMNSRIKMSRALSGDPAIMIGDILQSDYGLRSEKYYAYMPTKFTENIVIPYWSPFQAINYLQKRAISEQHTGANYVFYETTREFRFEPLEELFKQQPIKTLVYAPNNVFNDKQQRDYSYEASRIENFSRNSNFDSLKNISDGMYSGKLITHDILNKNVEVIDFNLMDEYDKMGHIEGDVGKTGQQSRIPASIKPDQFGLRIGDYDTSAVNFFPKHESMFEQGYTNRPEQWFNQRRSQLKQLDSLSLTVGIAGDSDLTVGKIVEVKIPSEENLDKATEKYDPILSGRYLVTSIAHSMSRSGYDMVLKLNKDSYGKPLPE